MMWLLAIPLVVLVWAGTWWLCWFIWREIRKGNAVDKSRGYR